GYAYDLRLSRTAWAWLPLAVAPPLVPVFAWVGTAGTVPGPLLVLVPIGMLAGGGLAVGNALVDIEADRSVGAPSIAVRLGRREAAALHAVALVAAVVSAVITLPPGGSAVAWAAVAGGAAVLGLGIATTLRATAAGSPGSPGSRGSPGAARLAWQTEAVGTAILGIGWTLAFVGSGLGAG
ncbi:MAG: UbiA family prenyltransferase, partial [Chloroflexota bacterium]